MFKGSVWGDFLLVGLPKIKASGRPNLLVKGRDFEEFKIVQEVIRCN